MAYIVNPKDEYIEEFEEPCNQCFNQVHYSRNEAAWGDVGDKYGYKYYIICPNCGNKMTLNFSNWSYLSMQRDYKGL